MDPNGFERRQAELKSLLEIEQEVEQKHPQTPIVVSGDFNGNASAEETDPEFTPIYSRTQLKDVFHLQGISKQERSTYYQVKTNGRTEGRQIDYCFLDPFASQHLKNKSAHVYRYKDEFGFKIDIPQTLDAKLALPSDHYPVVFEFENLKIK